ncbi:flagellar export chaperone FliS [Conyzicola nivalis]|uniref:Flagellar secretion chaperone FliS n=1 Tax=Conyzicola nivalis TaxID=1477021 RepID=A0A916SQA7_9MICO|nr:flagellar export chaperone FliS [Conyzicola nivalis]GGB10323.1 flagellar protein FliS [Conyzicola nivalis]
MTMYANAQQQRNRYAADAVMSASPARLLTMLYDRLLLDLSRAESAHETGSWSVASDNLLHAQDIITELTSSLKPELWDGGDRLLALYNYVSGALIDANVKRDTARIRESIGLLEPLRQAWHEAAAELVVSQPAAPRAAAAGGMLGVA